MLLIYLDILETMIKIWSKISQIKIDKFWLTNLGFERFMLQNMFRFGNVLIKNDEELLKRLFQTICETKIIKFRIIAHQGQNLSIPQFIHHVRYRYSLFLVKIGRYQLERDVISKFRQFKHKYCQNNQLLVTFGDFWGKNWVSTCKLANEFEHFFVSRPF